LMGPTTGKGAGTNIETRRRKKTAKTKRTASDLFSHNIGVQQCSKKKEGPPLAEKKTCGPVVAGSSRAKWGLKNSNDKPVGGGDRR